MHHNTKRAILRVIETARYNRSSKLKKLIISMREKKMTSKLYDRLKWIAQIALPALITFYGVIALTWGIPYTEQIMTTLGGLNVLLGALLAKSSADYYKEQAK